VDAVTNRQAELKWDGHARKKRYEQIGRGCSVVINHNLVSVSLPEWAEQDFEFCEVTYGPFHPEAGTV
jgi:hypothetical protein